MGESEATPRHMEPLDELAGFFCVRVPCQIRVTLVQSPVKTVHLTRFMFTDDFRRGEILPLDQSAKPATP